MLGVIDDVTRRTPSGFVGRRRAASSCSARPARSCPARSGRTSCTATSAACRRRSTSPPRSRLARAARRRRPRRAAHHAPTTSPTAASPRRSSRRACATASAPRCRCRGDPFVGAVLRVRAAGRSSPCCPTVLDSFLTMAASLGVPGRRDRPHRRLRPRPSPTASRSPSTSSAPPGAAPCRRRSDTDFLAYKPDFPQGSGPVCRPESCGWPGPRPLPDHPAAPPCWDA